MVKVKGIFGDVNMKFHQFDVRQLNMIWCTLYKRIFTDQEQARREVLLC